MPDLQKELKAKKDYVERAASAYKAFNERMNKNAVLTRAEKNARRRAFLDAHVSVFDDYYRTLLSIQVDEEDRNAGNTTDQISRSAHAMAEDISAYFDHSFTRGYVVSHSEAVREQNLDGDEINQRFNNHRVGTLERGRMIDARNSYMTQAKENFAKNQKRTSLDFSTDAQQPQNVVPGFNVPLSNEQIHGIRDISAFLYRNTLFGTKALRTDYTPFLDSLAMRSPAEKLLTYYLIEKDKIHGNFSADQIGEWLSYVPKLNEFKPKMFKGIFRGFFNRATGDSLNWDKLSDAANTAKEAMQKVNTLLSLSAANAPGRANRSQASVVREPISEIHDSAEVIQPPQQDIDSSQQIIPSQSTVSTQDNPDSSRPNISQNSEQSLIAQNHSQDLDADQRETQRIRQDPTGENSGSGGDGTDPELVRRINNVAEHGARLLQQQQPLREAFESFGHAVDDLNAYIASQESSGWADAKSGSSTVDRWIGYFKTPAMQTSTILKTIGKDTSNQSLTGVGTGFAWGGVPLTGISTIVSLVTLCASAREIFKGGKTGADFAIQLLGGFKDLSATLSGAYSTTRGIAGLANASWISSSAAVTAAGAGSIAIGGFSLLQGMSTMGQAQTQNDNLASYNKNFLSRGHGVTPNTPQKQVDELNEKKEMLRNITQAGRDSAERKTTAGAFQSLSGGLQVLSGATLLLGLPIFSAGFAIASLVVSLTGTIVNYFQKKAGKAAVIDRYIGMDQLYANFCRDHNADADRKAFHKKYGSENDIKKALRKHAEASLGFNSDDKMHAYIMWRYAQALYTGAFLKDNGQKLTKREYDSMTPAEKESRNYYYALLYSFGFKNILPRSSDEDPKPGLNAIYRKLME